jgi:glycerol-3-phosphate dehydrogenase
VTIQSNDSQTNKSSAEIAVNVVILGGGIAGLWLLNLLNDRGYSAVLVENNAIGSGQTLASQGMIHGGIKYTLAGATTPASETIAGMPERWRDCLAGKGSIDLAGVKTLSEDYFMFSDSRLSSKVTAFFGSKAIEGRVTPVVQDNLPEAFQHADFSGLVYRLQDVVLDTASLLQHLVSRQADSIYTGICELEIDSAAVNGVRLEDGSLIHADTYIFAAGKGNAELIAATGLPVEMQLRPLHQVVVTGDTLPDLYAHAVTLKSADKPRLTITTHRLRNGGKAWYLGGQLAETGVDRSDGAQIIHAKEELAMLLPWISFEDCQFSNYRVDRAEAEHRGQRPDTPYVKRFDNIIVCFPTKLTLTPMLGDLVLEELPARPSKGDNRPYKISAVNETKTGLAPWDTPDRKNKNA